MSAVKNVLLVMAGGQGTRFWPESTQSLPKQYSKLFGDKSLLEQTLDRFDRLISIEDRYVVTVNNQANEARNCSYSKIAQEGLIFEPEGRNTAPCILLSIQKLLSLGYKKDDVVVIVPSDHHIIDTDLFKKTIEDAATISRTKNKIVTIGIVPNFPHTGYGYIEKGKNLMNEAYNVASFKEKPNIELAKKYLLSGNYLWNAGMFVASIKVLLNEFATCAPEIYAFGQELMEVIDDDAEVAKVYSKIPKNSVDYAIMEKSRHVAVIPGMFGWNDLGAWDALEQVTNKTKSNCLVNCKDSFIVDSKDNIVFTPDRFVTLIGVSNLVVVANQRGVVVMDKARAQEIKDVVEYLKTNNLLQELIK